MHADVQRGLREIEEVPKQGKRVLKEAEAASMKTEERFKNAGQQVGLCPSAGMWVVEWVGQDSTLK